LLQETLEVADEEGTPVYVEAARGARYVFERAGFVGLSGWEGVLVRW
jgi:hypothetical protein